MSEIKVPSLGESVSEAIVAKWFKKPGDAVAKDELLVELETDKVTLEVNAPSAGALKEIKSKEGDAVKVGALLGVIEDGATGKVSANENKKEEKKSESSIGTQHPAPSTSSKVDPIKDAGPAARKMIAETGVSGISGTGKDGRVTKGDVINALESGVSFDGGTAGPREERVKMTKLRQTIARRLKESQNTAAMLTTFNEVDMSKAMDLRKKYNDAFLERHGVKLGFMSLFTKAAVLALKELPAVNAEIDGEEIVYKNYYDVGMAVGTTQGLVVPVVRGCDTLSLAGIEKEIARLAKLARDGKLGMKELSGGTFTITNGGIYGSMLSTPIINPPQSGILGLHNIVQRPVVLPDGKIEARPVMFVALTYDHRIIDGREAVTFLVRIKENMENPERMLLDL